jgi:hypothetical protein
MVWPQFVQCAHSKNHGNTCCRYSERTTSRILQAIFLSLLPLSSAHRAALEVNPRKKKHSIPSSRPWQRPAPEVAAPPGLRIGRVRATCPNAPYGRRRSLGSAGGGRKSLRLDQRRWRLRFPFPPWRLRRAMSASSSLAWGFCLYSKHDRHDGGVLDVVTLLGASCLETRLGGPTSMPQPSVVRCCPRLTLKRHNVRHCRRVQYRIFIIAEQVPPSTCHVLLGIKDG